MVEEDRTKSGILTFKKFLDNSILRAFLRFVSGKCEKDGESRLKVALELLVGQRENACAICSRIVYPLVKVFIGITRRKMGVSQEQFTSTFESPYWLRGLTSTIKGIAKFGALVPFVPGAPYLVVWNITKKCNLHCKHCYANAGEKAPDELNTEEALEALKMLSDMGVTVVSFSGGEPLAREDFMKILKKAHEYGMYTAIATNGTLLTKEICQELSHIMPSADDGYVEVSIDGATAESHDEFRGVPGAFDRAIQGIKNAVDAGLDVAIAPTVTRNNYEEVDDIIKLAEQLGVWRVMLFNFIPTGRGKDIIEQDITPRQREELLYKIMEWNDDDDLDLEVESTAPQLARVAYQLAKEGKTEKATIATHMETAEVSSELADVANFIGGCGAGRFYLALQPNGDITPCVFIPKKVGNIFEEDIQKLWDDNSLFWLLRDKSIPEECGECEYRYVCGGCRARSLGYFGTLTKPDIGCIRNQEAWQKLKRKREKDHEKKILHTVEHHD